LSVETHELAFNTGGVQHITYHNPELSADIMDDTERNYWANFQHPPIVFIGYVK
jgi:hypothetical protein